MLLIYLIRQHNRAALLLSLYGMIGGGLAFVFSYVVDLSLRHNAVNHTPVALSPSTELCLVLYRAIADFQTESQIAREKIGKTWGTRVR